jgi:DNA-binding transcriptional MerR regulator
MYQIGLFSQITKTTVKTLRYYDKIGILKPAYTNPENNYRYYTTEQFSKLQTILSLKQSGFSINEIISILDGRNIEKIFFERKKLIAKDVMEKKSALKKINYFLNSKKRRFFYELQSSY